MMPVVAQINQNQLAQHAMQLELFSDDVRYVQDSVANVGEFGPRCIAGNLSHVPLFALESSHPDRALSVFRCVP